MSKERITIVFDTETTGLIKPEVTDIKDQPQIIEYYGKKVIHRNDGVIEFIDDLHFYCKPEEPVSELITKITHITNEMLENKQKFITWFPNLADFHVGCDEWVAHNCAFDAAMIANEVNRIGKVMHFPFPPKHTCTVQATKAIEQRRLTLTKLHNYLFGFDFVDAHSAKGDVDALFKCYVELIKRGTMQ